MKVEFVLNGYTIAKATMKLNDELTMKITDNNGKWGDIKWAKTIRYGFIRLMEN